MSAAEAGIAPAVGRRGDSYDNALAESVIGLFKTEVLQRKGPWRHLEAVEFATLAWVDCSTCVGCSSRLATYPAGGVALIRLPRRTLSVLVNHLLRLTASGLAASETKADASRETCHVIDAIAVEESQPPEIRAHRDSRRYWNHHSTAGIKRHVSM
jgi:hypothetical protein